MKLVIVSGRSGSGKTITLHVLEDLGFYCVDNLPIPLLPNLTEALFRSNSSVAVSIDARNAPHDHHEFKAVLEHLRTQPGLRVEVLYLDASENILLKRFSETRRKHPLTSPNISLREAIRAEQVLISPVADQADLTLDTSDLSSHQLCQIIRNRCSISTTAPLNLLLESFGYKHGIPPEADFVFDARCLPNPYWSAELRPYSGLDAPIKQYLSKSTEVNTMIEDILAYLQKWLPYFKADNRTYLTVAVGCTGGQHRSVYVVETMAEKLLSAHPQLQVRHRDVERS